MATTSGKQHIGIVGQGAIGSLFAYYWRALNPTILTRSTNASAKHLDLLDASRTAISAPRCCISHQPGFTLDAIIIPIKCYQVAELAPMLTPWISKDTAIVLVQNGMGGGDILAKQYPNNPLYMGTTTDAVFKQGANNYQLTAVGKLDIGPFNNACHSAQSLAWLSAFVSAHPNAHIVDDISLALYRKLAVNAVINPLTAVLNVKNGELKHYPQQLAQAKAEVFSLYQALQIALPIPELEHVIDKVIESTSNNYSSMQQDIFYNRETEIEGVLGYLLTRGKKQHVNSPLLTSLYQKLLAHKQ